MMSTIIGMSVGGWMTGWIYVQTGSYTVAFLNGIAWNLVNITAMLWMLSKSRPRQTPALA